MATTADISVGMFIRHNNELCQVTEWQHRTPGNLRAFYQCKMRNVKNGKNLENRFRSGEEIVTVRVDVKEMQYLYKEGLHKNRSVAISRALNRATTKSIPICGK